MWNLKLEFENHQRAVADARRLHDETAEYCQRVRAEARITLVGVAPQAGGPRAWAPLIAAGLAPRPSAKGVAR